MVRLLELNQDHPNPLASQISSSTLELRRKWEAQDGRADDPIVQGSTYSICCFPRQIEIYTNCFYLQYLYLTPPSILLDQHTYSVVLYYSKIYHEQLLFYKGNNNQEHLDRHYYHVRHFEHHIYLYHNHRNEIDVLTFRLYRSHNSYTKLET